MFYEWKDIKGRKKEEKDRISIFFIFFLFFFLFFFFLFSQMNLLSYILCYFMLAYRVKAIIIITEEFALLRVIAAILFPKDIRSTGQAKVS